jgi:hypothetical protein
MHEFFEMLAESELISGPASTAFENELVNCFAYSIDGRELTSRVTNNQGVCLTS